MYLVAHRATERGILARTVDMRAEERQAALQQQRAHYEASLQEAEHIAEIKRVAAERAEAMVAEMKAMGYRFRHTYREIERRACKVFKVTISEIRSNRRSRGIVFARQFIMYWSTRLTKLSLPQIGRLMGGRDHTTILHGKNIYRDKRAYMGRNLRIAR
jgi:chromosomal replication initiation ATPase DnaA